MAVLASELSAASLARNFILVSSNFLHPANLADRAKVSSVSSAAVINREVASLGVVVHRVVVHVSIMHPMRRHSQAFISSRMPLCRSSHSGILG